MSLQYLLGNILIVSAFNLVVIFALEWNWKWILGANIFVILEVIILSNLSILNYRVF